MLAIITFITIYSLMLIDSVSIIPFNIHTIEFTTVFKTA